MILFAWSGFPQYAARCVAAFVKQTSRRVVVVATRPKIPISGMEKICSCEVFWINPDDHFDLELSLGECPRILIVGGWHIPAFNRMRKYVRRKGGRVFCSSDNNYILNFKTILKAIWFRVSLRHCYDGFFVPGKSGMRFLRFMGVPRDKIQMGMYAADAKLFRSEIPIINREKRIIYVGQICDRKNVRSLCEAFNNALSRMTNCNSSWRLELYGCGPLEDDLLKLIKSFHLNDENKFSRIRLYSFVQPEELARIYANSVGFVLASKEEHWGLVVHEAALSGCVLLVSKQVGSTEDFLMPGNGVIFDAFSLKEMTEAFLWLMKLNDQELTLASRLSVEMSSGVSVDKFVSGLNNLIKADNLLSKSYK